MGCDCGSGFVDYLDYVFLVVEKVVSGEVDRGILICGIGIGMSIFVNKVKGICCVLVYDIFSVKVMREYNDINIFVMGE